MEDLRNLAKTCLWSREGKRLNVSPGFQLRNEHILGEKGGNLECQSQRSIDRNKNLLLSG